MTPHFIPFESMSDAEQREHLRRAHGWDSGDLSMHDSPPLMLREHGNDHLDPAFWAADIFAPHTHDKPAPRPEEKT